MHQNNILLGTVTPKIMGALNANCSNMVKGADFKFDRRTPSDSPVPFPSPPLTSSPAPSLAPLPHPRTLPFSPAPSLLQYHFSSPPSLPSSPVPSLLHYPFAPHLPLPFPSPCSFPTHPLLSSPSIFPFRSVLLMPLTLSSDPSILPLNSLLPSYTTLRPCSLPLPCQLPPPLTLLFSRNLSLSITLPKLTHNLHVHMQIA